MIWSRTLFRFFPAVAATLFLTSLTACDSYYHSSDFRNLDNDFGKAANDTASATDTVPKVFELRGEFRLKSTLVPEKLEIAVIDDSLNIIEKTSAKITRNRTEFSFWIDEQEYPLHAARFKFTCTFPAPNDSLEMEFVTYLPVSKNESVKLDLFDALIGSRIESLVKQEGYSFFEAREVAGREASRLLEPQSSNKYGIENYPASKDSLEPLIYLYGRHFQEDSTFYASFDKLKKTLGSDKSWSQELPSTKIADALVKHFSIDDPDYFASVYPTLKKDPDFDRNMHQAAFRIVEAVYGMPLCNFTGTTTKASASESEFDGMNFVCDFDKSADSTEHVWRAMSELETVLGPCTKATSDTVAADSAIYACTGNHAWKVISANYTEIKNTTFDGIVTELFGKCFIGTENKKVHNDTLFAECRNEKWTAIDEIVFYEGRCSLDKANQKISTPSGHYYQCKDSTWKPITAPDFYGDSCNANGKVVIRDSTYFICNNGWNALNRSYTSSPADSLGSCTDSSRIETYEGNFFMCDSGYWRKIPPEILLPRNKNGRLCTNDNFGELVLYNDTNYVCSFPLVGSGTRWLISSEKTVPEEIKKQNQLHGDVCKKGNKGTSFVWSDSTKRYMGCNAESSSWLYICFYEDYYFHPIFNNGTLENGAFINDTVYQAEIQGVRYKFSYQGKRQFRNEDFYQLTDAETDGTLYKAEAFRNRLFLSTVGGTETKALGEIDNRTASVQAYLDNRSKSYMYPMRDITFEYWSETAYTDFNTAAHFCPEGFHLPDTTGWPPIPARNQESYENTYPFKVYINGFQKSVTMLWTSVEKDDSTQYCLENISLSYNTEETNIVECPKDMYPMIQPLCIKDE